MDAIKIIVNPVVPPSPRLFLATVTLARGITLSWNANTASNIAGLSPLLWNGRCPLSSTLNVSGTTATVSGLQDGATYTFAVTAYDTTGAESPYSGPVSYTAGSSQVILPAILANIFTRSNVQTGDQVMIGGFIVGGTTGSKVMVRAIGPSLSARGVADALQNPRLDLYDKNGILIGSNDSWRSNQEADIVASALAPTDGRESAIIATLVPGAYSAIVSGANGSSGVALVEVYALN